MNSASANPSRRSIADFLKPLVADATTSRLVRQTGLRFERGGQVHELPRFQFVELELLQQAMGSDLYC